jgi:hypothetical protein
MTKIKRSSENDFRQIESSTKKVLVSSFTNKIDLDTYLWRYFDLKGFLYFLTFKALNHTRIDQFQDGNEGKHPETIILDLEKEKRRWADMWLRITGQENSSTGILGAIKSRMEEPVISNTFSLFRESEEKSAQMEYFVNCWHSSLTESPLMWGIYSNIDGIAIKITYRDLKNLFKDMDTNIESEDPVRVRIEEVQYIDISKESEKLREMELGFFKHDAYRYENEIRIVSRKIGNFNSPNPIDNLDLIFKDISKFTAVFHPLAPQWFKESIKSIVKQMNVDLDVSNSRLNYRSK